MSSQPSTAGRTLVSKIPSLAPSDAASAWIVSPRTIARPVFRSLIGGHTGRPLPLGSPVAAKFTRSCAIASSSFRSTSLAFGVIPARWKT